MSDVKRGPVASFFYGIWTLIRVTNHLLLLAMFAFLFLFFIIGLAASAGNKGGVKAIQEKTALVLNLEGNLVEQYTTDPISRAFAQATGDGQTEIQLRDLITVLKAAKTDKKIDRILLQTDGLSVSGFAALRDVAAALRDFKTSGKQIIAYGVNMDQKQYYLAAQADKIYIDPEGGVLLEGLGRYRLYFREGLQEKLGLDVHLFRVGEYKSAMEPYILDAASPESREADMFWMNDLWQRYVTDIAKARKISAEQLNTSINNLSAEVKAASGDLGKLAVQQKLVDGLKTSHEIEEMLSQMGAVDDEIHSFRQVEFSQYLKPLNLPASPFDTTPQVAVVVAQGEIVDGEANPGTVGGETTSALIRQAREDENTKALVLRVDSPGGSVFPSEQIRREIELTKKAGIPVVVSMSNVAASGGYWISMNADKIIADESTITGSIGIFGLWMTAPRALEKIGVHADGSGTTPLAGQFDPTLPLKAETGELIQSIIDRGYRQFIGKVATARGSKSETIDTVARGRVWSGAQAKERGLVDQLGGFQMAIDEAVKLAKLGKDDYRLNYVERPATPFEAFVASLNASATGNALLRNMSPMNSILGRETTARVQKELSWLDRNARTPYQGVVHCMCGL
ncbi:MAG TPA: signal peptide peptidase SppA [Arenimonas sp.]|nr:signal peptide peptidase SppA [Arenimonas sp.]HPO23689.1 signal peptide peptidase SppA [Arenimonas sp.]HPW32548.1 signal peptide peptidase SppA [Arenimonas sp.]